MMLSNVLKVVALVVVVLTVGCGRTRTNTYELEITGPNHAERVKLLLDGREIAAFAGHSAKVVVSLDERTPFPNAKRPVAMTAEFLGPDGWTTSAANVLARGWPETIESGLAKGEIQSVGITLEGYELSQSMRVYVDNRGGKEAARVALGQAERSVAAGETKLLEFLSPTRQEGMVVRVDGVEVGRVHAPKAIDPNDEEKMRYGPREESCWLVDVSGQHVYRRRVVVFQERLFSYTAPYKKDPGTILKSARLYEIPKHQIDYFLERAPSSIMSQDLGVIHLELVDAK